MTRVSVFEQTNNLYYRAKALVDRLLKRKTAQNSGADVTTYKPSSTTAVYDMTVPAKGSSPYGFLYKTMRFTAGKVNMVAGGFRFNVCKGSPTTLANKGDFRIEQQDLNFTNVNNQLRCGINVYNYTNQTLYLKVYVYATDTGIVVVDT